MATARGIRNNNPGNLRLSKDPWQGLAQTQTDEEFFQFSTPVDGIRALAKTLLTYHDKRRARDGSKVDDLIEVISRWAPPRENDTVAYVKAVSRDTKFPPAMKLDLHRHEHMAPLVKAIIRHENGSQPYTDAQIDAALARIAIFPERPKELSKSRTVRGAKAAATGGGIAVGLGTLTAVSEAVPALREISDFVREYTVEALVIVGVLALVGAGYAIYAKWDERRKGIS